MLGPLSKLTTHRERLKALKDLQLMRLGAAAVVWPVSESFSVTQLMDEGE